MGTTESKPAFKEALGLLTSHTQPIESGDVGFWDHFWSESVGSVQQLFAGTTAEDVRSLREKSPANLATLAFKAVEKLLQASETGCSTQQEQQTVLNCVRVLTRVLPFVLEEADWRGLFWASPSSQVAGESAAISDAGRQKQDGGERRRSQTAAHAHPPAAHTLISALCDLLFCPDFTVAPTANPNSPDQHEDIQSIDSCEYIWSQGVGFTGSVVHSSQHDANRCELLKLLLTTFSETIYLSADDGDQTSGPNNWVKYFVSSQNRHALPLFTSLLNVVCSYDPVGLGVPYNHLVFSDPRESLVETALHVLIVTLDHNSERAINDEESDDNLFINYLSRIHREEDFDFVLKGFTRLLNNPLTQTYLPNSTKKIQFHQELLVFFWKCCDYNKKFLYFVLKSGDVLHVTVPILFHLNESRADPSRVGLMHIGVFILLLLSGERNFGVRLNKPYLSPVGMDVPIFSGTHGDLLVVVFHKIITTGHQRLQPLFDCLLTILVNVSPYLKTLSMVSSTKLLHLLEAFSTPWFLFSQQNNHHLVFFLLEIFNNIIQYQFDGNSNLVYTIIRKRQVFHALANLPTDIGTIDKSLLNKRARRGPSSTEPSSPAASTTDNSAASIPVDAAESITDGAVESIPSSAPKSGGQISTGLLPESGTLNATLAATPRLERMTERESAHPPRSSGGVLPSSAACSTPSELPDTPTSVFSGSLSSADQDGNRREQSIHVKPPASVGLVSGSPRYDRRTSPSVERWTATSHWVASWKNKLPLQTIMRLLQVLVPQVEKICIDKGLTDESEILKFLQHGTLVGLLPVPHPILIRKYQANAGTSLWFRTYMWGVIYLRNVEPPIWFDTEIKLFEVHRN